MIKNCESGQEIPAHCFFQMFEGSICRSRLFCLILVVEVQENFLKLSHTQILVEIQFICSYQRCTKESHILAQLCVEIPPFRGQGAIFQNKGIRIDLGGHFHKIPDNGCRYIF